ncbi:MAG: 7TM diverse intracellular signaling domain-containing protein, partial [Leptospiraceae bacterium]|nr:7TM diverse intracellular signaling domain-containing protein [Leptospiraceae bacterium]
MLKLVIIYIVSLLVISCKDKSLIVPKAEKGVLNLQNWDFSKNSTINLDGEWEFYWGEFLDPKRCKDNACPEYKERNFIQFPTPWQKIGYPIDGYATYRLQILLPKNSKENLEFLISDASSNYEMYINEELFSSNGKVGKSKEDSVYFLKFYNIPLPERLLGAEKLDILIHVSNFYEQSGGFWDTIKLGSKLEIETIVKKKYGLDLVVFGFLFMMSLYHLGLYSIRKKDISPLYFGVFCLLVAFRVISTEGRILLDFFPDFPFFIVRKIEFLSFYFGAYLFLQFLKAIFPEGILKKVYNGLSFVFLTASFLVILFPTKVYLSVRTIVHIAILVQIIQSIYVLLLAVKHKKLGAKLFLIGVAIFSATTINDILKAQSLLQTTFLASYGLLVFTFFQAIVLSRRFADGLDRSEKLAKDLEQKSNRLEETTIELKELTENLEIKVKERTQELELSNKEIEKLNKITKKINSVADLTDVMTFVIFHLEREFKFNEFWMLLKDAEKNELKTFSLVSPFLQFDTTDQLKLITISLNEPSLLLNAYHHKKVKQELIDNETVNPLDKRLYEIHKFRYYLSLPFVVYDDVVGILLIHNKTIKDVPSQQMEKLQNFVNQTAGAIANSKLYKQIQEEKEKALVARKEIEKLNEFTKLINSTSDISLIMNEVYKYLNELFGFTNVWTLLVDKISNEFYTSENLTIYRGTEDINSNYFRNFREKIDERLGTLYVTYAKKTPLYIPDVLRKIPEIRYKQINSFNEEIVPLGKVDFNIARFGKIYSALQFPLIVKDEVIGILNLSISKQDILLNRNDLEKLTRFSDQIAGIIYTAQLLKETEVAKEKASQEKEKALVAEFQAVNAKQQTEFINEFSKVINSSNKLEEIFLQATIELNKRFDMDMFLLQLVDEAKNELFTRCLSVNIAPEYFQIFSKLRIPINEESGSIYITYTRKKTLYLKNTNIINKSKVSYYDQFFIKLAENISILQIPLIVNNRIIGIFHLNRIGGIKKLNKDEIRFIETLCEQLAIAVKNSYLYEETEKEREKSEKLLLNILPEDVANELKEKGFAEPVLFESVSVMFTDF